LELAGRLHKAAPQFAAPQTPNHFEDPMNRTALAVSAVVLLFVSTGCSSTTMIRSRPSGATVRNVRGEKLCKTPCNFSGGGMINSTEMLTLEKEGFEEDTLMVRKDHINGLAIAGLVAGALATSWTLVGLGLLVPIPWMADFAPAYNVELEPIPMVAPAAPPGVAPEAEDLAEALPGKPSRTVAAGRRR